MKTNLKLKQEIYVNLKPTESQLEALGGYWNAIDTLIVHNCFIDNNPMRKEPDDALFWEWAIVSIDGHDFPMPYHTASKDQSNLFTYNGVEVFMTHEDCALTTTCFYLYYLRDISYNWALVKKHIHPFLASMVRRGVDEIRKIDEEEFSQLIFKIKEQLPPSGWRVLD